MKLVNEMSFKKIISTKLYLMILFIYLALVTRGTFNLIGDENKGSSYDSLSVSLLKGSAEIGLQDLSGECNLIENKYYMYFGPFPSFLRLFLNFVSPTNYGKWARVSCLISVAILLIFLFRIIDLVLKKNINLSPKDMNFLFVVSILSFTLSSPVVFLISCASIYHEAILWGLCWSICSFYYFLYYLENESDKPKAIYFMSIFTGLALLSRITFSLHGYLILLMIFLYELVKIKSIKKFFNKYLASLIVIVLFTLFQLWYNYARYKSIFLFSANVETYFPCIMNFDSACQHIAKSGSFNLNRLIPSLINYFLPLRECFLIKFPFFTTVTPSLGIPRIYSYNEPTFPLLLTFPLIISSSIIGFVYLIKSKISILYKASFSFFLLEPSVLLLYQSVSNRYTADFIPLFAYLFVIFASNINLEIYPRQDKLKIKAITVVILFFSIYSTFASVFYWNAYQNWAAPTTYRESLIEAFKHVNGNLGLSDLGIPKVF